MSSKRISVDFSNVNKFAEVITRAEALNSFIHSLKLYKIADKTLLSNVSTMESNIACLMQ